jgi:predicted HicB family RNase H-like nuclease
MNSLFYKGYSARIDFSDEDDCFIGHIIGIKDVIGFHGETVKELKSSFYEAVDDYKEACEAIGKKPQKPYSGNLMLRIPPEVHAAVATAAQVHGVSINQWASKALLRESAL